MPATPGTRSAPRSTRAPRLWDLGDVEGADGVGGAVTLWSGRVGAGGRRSAVLCRSGFGLGTGSLRGRVSSLGAASEQSHWFVSFGWVHVRRTWHGGTSTSRSARSWSAVTCL